MSANATYYFDVKGMYSAHCANKIEKKLKEPGFVVNASASASTNQLVVEIHKDKVKCSEVNIPKKIVDLIGEEGYTASWIHSNNEETLHFAIKGLSLPEYAKKIEEHLKQKSAYIKSCMVEYSTKNATIVICLNNEPGKKEQIIKQIRSDIRAAIKNKNLNAIYVSSNFVKNQIKDDPRAYFNKAKINATIGSLLLILSMGGFIPLPLSWMGLTIGSAIGAGIFWVMRETGKEFYTDAWNEFYKRRSFNMNTLIALGTGSAWVYSMILVLAPMLMPTLFPIAAIQYQFLAVNMILGIVNFGRGIKAYAQEQTKREIRKLSQVYINLQPQVARKLKLKNDKNDLHFFEKKNLEKYFEEIKYGDIKEGDIIQVKVGERFPVEGTIVNNVETFVNQDNLTGESTPCYKTKGDEVFSGSMNTKNIVYIRASRSGSQSHLTRVIEDVAKSSVTRPSISRHVDKLAVIFVPTILCLSFASALGWYLFGPVSALPLMVKSAMSVLLCACPCALGLATPISTALSMYKLFNKGILVYNANALEVAANIDTVVFDKTGTLTKPVVDVNDENGVFIRSKELNRLEVLQYVASLEQKAVKNGFDHPIARSFINSNLSMKLLNCTKANKDEQGVSGEVEGVCVLAGSVSHLESHKVKVPQVFKKQGNKNEREGKTSVYVALDGKCVAVVALKHDVCEDAYHAINDLRKIGIQNIYLLTGDKQGPAEAIAKKLGIYKVEFEKDSNMKEKFIQDLKKGKHCVAMVGDGVNDLKAIAGADLGVAVGPWTDASSASQVALQKLNLATFIVIAKETMRNIHQNLWWTGFYNVFSLIAATGLLYPLLGFTFNPVIASMAMAFSSIFVVINSKRLAHQIDYQFNIYEGKVPKPKTFFERMTYLFSPKIIYKTVYELISKDYADERMKEENTPTLNKSMTHSPNSTPIFFKTKRMNDSLDTESEDEQVVLLGIKPKRRSYSPNK